MHFSVLLVTFSYFLSLLVCIVSNLLYLSFIISRFLPFNIYSFIELNVYHKLPLQYTALRFHPVNLTFAVMLWLIIYPYVLIESNFEDIPLETLINRTDRINISKRSISVYSGNQSRFSLANP